jgi:hypothetical protein
MSKNISFGEAGILGISWIKVFPSLIANAFNSGKNFYYTPQGVNE